MLTCPRKGWPRRRCSAPAARAPVRESPGRRAGRLAPRCDAVRPGPGGGAHAGQGMSASGLGRRSQGPGWQGLGFICELTTGDSDRPVDVAWRRRAFAGRVRTVCSGPTPVTVPEADSHGALQGRLRATLAAAAPPIAEDVDCLRRAGCCQRRRNAMPKVTLYQSWLLCCTRHLCCLFSSVTRAIISPAEGHPAPQLCPSCSGTVSP